MILGDSSGLLALLDTGERDHERCRDAVSAAGGPLVTTDLVLAEADFLVQRRLGAAAERAFVDQIVAGAIAREPVRTDDVERAREILHAYADQELGLTDATLMAIAERLGAPVLTLDLRRFGVFRTRPGHSLDIRP